jgi:glucokinase
MQKLKSLKRKTSKVAGKSAATVIGVDLGGTNVRSGLVSIGDLRIMDADARKINSQGTAREVFYDLCLSIDSVIANSAERPKGIGIGVPSLVNSADGTIHDTTNIPSWKSVPLKTWLEKKYRIPVRIDNDANCFALGEKHFGHGRTHTNFVGLIIGTGLGAGIISRGKLHSGTHCAAGEFGQIPYKNSTIEAYASGQFFIKHKITGVELFKKAKLGDEKALKVFADYGHHLGHAIKVVMYSLAPEMIVLGGSVTKARKFFEPSLKASLEDFAYRTVAKKTVLKTSRLKHSSILSAASLILD